MDPLGKGMFPLFAYMRRRYGYTQKGGRGRWVGGSVSLHHSFIRRRPPIGSAVGPWDSVKGRKRREEMQLRLLFLLQKMGWGLPGTYHLSRYVYRYVPTYARFVVPRRTSNLAALESLLASGFPGRQKREQNILLLPPSLPRNRRPVSSERHKFYFAPPPHPRATEEEEEVGGRKKWGARPEAKSRQKITIKSVLGFLFPPSSATIINRKRERERVVHSAKSLLPFSPLPFPVSLSPSPHFFLEGE